MAAPAAVVDPRAAANDAPAPEPTSKRSWRTWLYLGLALLFSLMISIALGYSVAIATLPPQAPPAEEDDEQITAPVDLRPVRGIDIARERGLNSGSEVLAMDLHFSGRGRATEHYQYDSLAPETDRELHRSMAPRLFSGEAIEVGGAATDLRDAGRLGGIEPMAERRVERRAVNRTEPDFPTEVYPKEPRDIGEAPLPAALESDFADLGYNNAN